MPKAIMLLCALALVGCTKDRDKPGVTETTGATTGAVDVDSVRVMLVERNPDARADIQALIISSENGTVTIRGFVDDEQTHQKIVRDVKSHPDVKSVRDELRVAPRENHQQPRR